MNYLPHELEVWRAELQRLDTAAAQLNANAAQLDQLAAAAAGRAAAANADATRLRNEAAALQQQAADLDTRIKTAQDQLAQEEPFFEGLPGKPPRPNPAYTSLKTLIASLTQQRDQVRAQATARSAAADQSAATAAAEDQNAKRLAREADALRQQANAVLARKGPATEQIAAISRWQQELARHPLDFAAADLASRQLAAAIATLELQYAGAGDSAAAAEKRQRHLQTLAAELTRKLADVNSQLAAAVAQVVAETRQVAELQTHIHNVLLRKSL